MQTAEDTQEEIKKAELHLRQLRIKFAVRSIFGIPVKHKTLPRKRKKPRGISKTFNYSDNSTDEEVVEYDDDGFVIEYDTGEYHKDGMMRFSMRSYVRTITDLAGNLHIAVIVEDRIEPLQDGPKVAKDSATLAVNEFRTALAEYDKQCKSHFNHSATTPPSKKFDVAVLRQARMLTEDKSVMSKVTCVLGGERTGLLVNYSLLNNT